MEKELLWKKFYSKNNYYHSQTFKIINKLVEKEASVIEFGSRAGELLGKLPQKKKLGVIVEEGFKKDKVRKSIINLSNLKKVKTKFDYVILNHSLAVTPDIQEFLQSLKKVTHENSVIIVLSFNNLWRPLADIAERTRLKYPYPENPNWLDRSDLTNIFNLEGYKPVTSEGYVLMPFYIPHLSSFINKYIAPLPFINRLCLINVSVFKPAKKYKDYSVSVIIPARNEEGNMKGVLKKIPFLGKSTEVIFVEGHSGDNTKKAIFEEIKSYKGKINASLYNQKGKGKGDAVRLGFRKAKGEILMILDADLTVDPGDLPKFYKTIASGKGDFIMGSRFVYPMQNKAMRTLNYLGNKIFSILFSYLLSQSVKDTLCGTKVLFKKDYEKIEKGRSYFGEFDPFGDYDLIFGAKKLNLKIIEIPIRYKERVYGKTNISRFTHGFLLLKMSLIAAKKLKFRD